MGTPEDSNAEDFSLAAKVFGLMTMTEKERVLVAFASLRYPSVRDRFFEAVYRVVTERVEVAK